MGSVGEVSGIVTARQVLDRYATLNSDEQLAFFCHLEQNFNMMKTKSSPLTPTMSARPQAQRSATCHR